MRFIAFAAEPPVSYLVSLSFLPFTTQSTAETWCSGARWEYRMTIWSVLRPSGSATVTQIDSAITSLLAEV